MARLLDRLLPAPPADRAGLVEVYESWSDRTEHSLTDFKSYVTDGYKRNGIIFACILVRMMLLSEVEFAYQDITTKRLSRNPTLSILRKPWPNGTTGDLVSRAEQDGSLAGNSYDYLAEPDRVQRLRPDWVSIVGTDDGRDLLGYIYEPPGGKQKLILPEEMAHWSPIPDPEAAFRGMSWLQPVATEILADTEMTRHKRAFLKNAATPNLIVKLEGRPQPEVKEAILKTLAEKHTRPENAYRTLLLEGGADVQVVGRDLRQLEFAVTQSAGENRIASAAGVPSIVAGFKEGLQAATYSNFAQAMRRFGDLTARPLWRGLASTLEALVPVEDGSRLWFDTSEIAALRQDETDQAAIQSSQSSTIANYVREGFTPESAIDAVATDDVTKLVHSGLMSVQLQPALGTGEDNGDGDEDDDAVTDDGDDATVEEETE